jgi:hypothetical protein
MILCAQRHKLAVYLHAMQPHGGEDASVAGLALGALIIAAVGDLKLLHSTGAKVTA